VKPVSKKASKLDSSSEDDCQAFYVDKILDKEIKYGMGPKGHPPKECIVYFISWKGYNELDI